MSQPRQGAHNISSSDIDDGQISVQQASDNNDGQINAGSVGSDTDIGFADRFASTVATGPEISKVVASSLRYLMYNKLEEKAISETMDKYEAPKNCPEIRLPKVNSEIFNNIPSRTRSVDVKLQRVQKPFLKGLIALSRTLPESLSVEQQDALALLSSANFELNMLRRELIKPDINPGYAELCKPSVEVTEYLFGDDMSKHVKDMTETNKATDNLMKPSFPMNFGFTPKRNWRGGHRYAPYTPHSRGRGNFGNRGAFLGRGFNPQMRNNPGARRAHGRGRGRRPPPSNNQNSQ